MTSTDPASDLNTLSKKVLAVAVESLGGAPRAGQERMVESVDHALETGTHLLVQAGTGTGKSLGYLVPSLLWAQQHGERAIVATATLALQAQLATKDVPVVLDAIKKVTGHRPTVEIVKGRSNYACLLRTRDGTGLEQDTLLGGGEIVEAARASGADAESVLGAEVLQLREWIEDELKNNGLADRDDAPTHSQRAWAQVSVPVRECVGAANCRFGAECFVELSRARARTADLVITNHALLAIDAMHGNTTLPEHKAVIIDEAHELTSRVTGAASAELSPQQIERVAKRCTQWIGDDLAVELLQLADTFEDALATVEVGRVTEAGSVVVQSAEVIREVTRRAISAMSGSQPQNTPERTQATGAVREIFDVAERIAGLSDADVVWVSERERFGRQLNVAPLSVAGLMRENIVNRVTTVLTSATLTLGGQFNSVAGSIGLRKTESVDEQEFADRPPLAESTYADDDGDDDDRPVLPQHWHGVDVGSPFNYAQQGILYVAKSLPKPGRDGISQETLQEVAQLLWASGGRTLGLFSSQRAAEAAAKYVRAELPGVSLLCQGEAQLSELTKRFIADDETSLFGTLSLWQGIDVPGDTCRLVIIDKIPFPRPDDPLMQARQQAVAEAGGNGFMQVAAAHAGLLLAQGTGRLIRRQSDRGVVAILDPRLVTARYGSFLRACIPDFWMTTDQEVAVNALRRLDEAKSEK